MIKLLVSSALVLVLNAATVNAQQPVRVLKSETARDQKIEDALVKHYSILQKIHSNDSSIEYWYRKVDLNDDKKPEIIAYVRGSRLCGAGGCPLIIFQSKGSEYHVLHEEGVVHFPIGVTNYKFRGYKTLLLHRKGGYIQPLRFNAREYFAVADPEQSQGAHLRDVGVLLSS